MSRKFFEGLDNQTQIRLVRQLFFSAEGLSISTLERFAKQPSMLLLGWEKDLITEGMEKVYWDDISIVEEIRTVGFNLIRVLYSQGLTAEDPNFFLCKSSDQKFYNLVKKYAPEGNPLRVWVEENEVRR